MKTLLYAAFDTLTIAEKPRPTPAPDEVLLRVRAVGICGSELEGVKNRSPRRMPPLVMGHEFCGTVEEIGAGVSDFRAGQQVIALSVFGCGECVRCRRGDTHLCSRRQLFGMHRQGAFAEYVTAPTQALLNWPDTLPAEAAALTEPLANGVHMVRLTKEFKPETVLVIGAGPIGLMAQQVFAALTGARVFVADLSDHRLGIAQKTGATGILNARQADTVEWIQAQTDGEGADVVIDAVGSGLSKRQAVAAARPGGTAVWIGLHENSMTLDSYDITLPEKRVLGTYAATRPDMEAAVALMATGRVDVTSWIQTFPLTEGVEAFHCMLDPQEGDVKAVLMP